MSPGGMGRSSATRKAAPALMRSCRGHLKRWGIGGTREVGQLLGVGMRINCDEGWGSTRYLGGHSEVV